MVCTDTSTCQNPRVATDLCVNGSLLHDTYVCDIKMHMDMYACGHVGSDRACLSLVCPPSRMEPLGWQGSGDLETIIQSTAGYIIFLLNAFFRNDSRASLVAQWLRIHLPMQRTWVQALVWEDPTCCGATKPVRHNY